VAEVSNWGFWSYTWQWATSHGWKHDVSSGLVERFVGDIIGINWFYVTSKFTSYVYAITKIEVMSMSFSILNTPSIPLSAIQHENSLVNSCILVYTFVLTKITLCSDLECPFGCFGPQKIQKFQILAKI
jgi:hypothetical protein